MLWALRSVMPRLAAMSRRRTPGSCAMHSSTRAWLVRKVQFTIASMLPDSGNNLLVFGCERSLKDTHRTSAAEGGQLPGATGGGHAHRPGHHRRRGNGARGAAHPAEAAGARCKPPGQAPWPGGSGSGDTMNAFTAHDLEAEDLLALARLDDGAPPAVTPPQASDGQGRHPIRLAGTGPTVPLPSDINPPPPSCPPHLRHP